MQTGVALPSREAFHLDLETKETDAVCSFRSLPPARGVRGTGSAVSGRAAGAGHTPSRGAAGAVVRLWRADRGDEDQGVGCGTGPVPRSPHRQAAFQARPRPCAAAHRDSRFVAHAGASETFYNIALRGGIWVRWSRQTLRPPDSGLCPCPVGPTLLSHWRPPPL